jgi:hypothetical protein
VKTGIQAFPWENREPVFKNHGFPASSAGQALLTQEWQKISFSDFLGPANIDLLFKFPPEL